MIGFVTSQETADAINQAIADAQLAQGFPIYWIAGYVPISSGVYEGQVFIPFDNVSRNTIMRNGMRLEDFPEFIDIVTALGGLEALVNIPTEFIINNT